MFFRFLAVLLGRSSDTAPEERAKSRARPKQRRRRTVDRHAVDKSPETRKQREENEKRRKLAALKAVGIITGALALTALAWFAIKENVIDNPRYSLQHFEVPNEGMLTKDQIIRLSGLSKGQNLLTVNLMHVRETLERHPAIASATVTRDFEGNLTLDVTQRKPVLWVENKQRQWIPRRVGQGLLADADGRAIPAETHLPEFETLPVISDETIKDIQPGKIIDGDRFKAAMQLMRLLQERESRDGNKLASITVKNQFALVAAFQDSSKITFSYDGLDAEITRYDRLMAAAHQKQWSIASASVVGEHYAPVTFHPRAVPITEPEPAPSTPAAPATRSGNGKASSTPKASSTSKSKGRTTTPAATRTRTSNR